MTGGTLAWGCAAAALCFIAGLLAGMWIGYGRGYGHGTEEAGWQHDEAAARRPAPARPPAPAEAPRPGPGKHRHPAGPRHAALPVAGYLPAPGGPWDGTITVPAPAQALPPWDARPPQPEPEVLEPTAVLPGQPETDTAWTRRRCAELQAYMDQLMEQSEPVLKELTR